MWNYTRTSYKKDKYVMCIKNKIDNYQYYFTVGKHYKVRYVYDYGYEITNDKWTTWSYPFSLFRDYDIYGNKTNDTRKTLWGSADWDYNEPLINTNQINTMYKADIVTERINNEFFTDKKINEIVTICQEIEWIIEHNEEVINWLTKENADLKNIFVPLNNAVQNKDIKSTIKYIDSYWKWEDDHINIS